MPTNRPALTCLRGFLHANESHGKLLQLRTVQIILVEFKQRVDSVQLVSADGTFIWNICNLSDALLRTLNLRIRNLRTS